MMKTSTKYSAASSVVEGELLPATPTKINLSTPEDVRREMARVYRECRTGKLDAGIGTKLIFMLSQITKVYEVALIERRLADLEIVAKRGVR